MLENLKNYEPYNEQEKKDKQLILNYLDSNSDILHRSNLAAHLTSSAIVVNDQMDKVLFAHHNIYDAWGWVGGHNDGDKDCLKVALKEAKEETGVTKIHPFTDDILMIDVIYVENHIKHHTYVPDHLHLNVTYLLVANETEKPSAKKDENSAVKWFNIEDVLAFVDEPRMIPIYKKAFEKIERLKKVL
ncbi:MAG: NUDIX hydrolase [Candidatus Izimaplasma sp.]|nr:NUDIX hydrolase [Candidatus Izimaplasma bacterium]